MSKDFGDFQESAGRGFGQLGMISGLIVGIVMIIIAIALGVGAFIPMSIGQQSSNFNCKTQTDGICQPGEKCIDGKCTAPDI